MHRYFHRHIENTHGSHLSCLSLSSGRIALIMNLRLQPKYLFAPGPYPGTHVLVTFIRCCNSWIRFDGLCASDQPFLLPQVTAHHEALLDRASSVGELEGKLQKVKFGLDEVTASQEKCVASLSVLQILTLNACKRFMLPSPCYIPCRAPAASSPPVSTNPLTH